MQIPSYIVNTVEKPLQKAGYSLHYQNNGITRYIRGKYEVNIMLDLSIPFRLYLVRRNDANSVFGLMSTTNTFGNYIYENAPVTKFMEIATAPDSNILLAVNNRVTEKILDILE